MASSTVPSKTRDVFNHHSDSTIWNDFPFRPDDIVVATYAKSGTTWTQQILSQLIHKGDPTVSSSEASPWVDLRFVPREVTMGGLEAQTHRRFMKTHLPIDAMVWDPKVKYIFVARDGRDMVWSLHNHFTIANDTFYSIINDTPGRVGPPFLKPSEDPRDILIDIIEDDTRATVPWPFWSHIRGWWAARDQPNFLLLHFNDLKADLEGEMRRVAKFLDMPDMPETEWKAAVEHCTFDWMKEHADRSAPSLADQVFEGGAKGFIHKGTNRRWTTALSEEDNQRYMSKAKQELGEECALWLEKGRLQQ